MQAINLIQVWRWKRANKPDYEQDNWWQNKEGSNDQKQNPHCFKPKNEAGPKLNKCVHKRKYVTQVVTTQAICLRSTTIRPVFTRGATK